MNELISIYDRKLCEALTYSIIPSDSINLKGVKEYILKKDFILKYVNFIKKICSDNNSTLSTEYCRQNILMIINHMRFNYNYQNEEEKENLYKYFNECIYLMNQVDVLGLKINLNNGQVQAEERQIQEIVLTLEFQFIYFFLIDYDTFIEKGIPSFFLKQLWLPTFYSLIARYPNLVDDEEFVKRTRIIVDAVLHPERYAGKEEYDEDLDEYKKEYIKLDKMLYKKTK